MESQKVYKTFTELETWQKARELKISIYTLVKTFPSSEKFRLEDQIIRSSRSISANIAEGYGRFTYKDQIRFCMHSRGSLHETHNHLIDALDCNYITNETLNEYVQQIISLERLLNGYIAWLKKKMDANL